MDKLRAIRFFCRTVETKSFTAAAHSLDVPQSVLSKGIAALEAELQFTLFNRSTRRLALTEAGAHYYTRCRQLMLDIEEAETIGRKGVVQPTGTVRIGLHPVFQISLYRRMGEFLAANPGVNADLVHTNSPTALVDDGLDVVVRVGPVTDSNFVARKIGSVEAVVCASPGHLDLHGRPKHPGDLSGYHAIIPGRPDEDPFTRWTFTKGSQREVVSLPVRLVLREGVGLALAAMGGIGLVRIYDFAAKPFIAAGDLEAILTDWSCGREPVHAVIPSRQNVPAKVRAFIDFARTLFVA